MGKLTDALRSAAKAAKDEYATRTAESDARGPGDRFAAAGVVVQCQHCRHDRFEARTVLVNDSVLASHLFDTPATALFCTRCTHIMSFGSRPERLDG